MLLERYKNLNKMNKNISIVSVNGVWKMIQDNTKQLRK